MVQYLEKICLNATIPKKVFISIVLIIFIIVQYYEFISYFNKNKLNGMFIYSIIFYYIIIKEIFPINFILEWRNCLMTQIKWKKCT